MRTTTNNQSPSPDAAYPCRATFLRASDPFDVAAARPDVRVLAFETDWSAIDRGRERARERGMAGRVFFHHRRALLCPLVRYALTHAGECVVVVKRR